MRIEGLNEVSLINLLDEFEGIRAEKDGIETRLKYIKDLEFGDSDVLRELWDIRRRQEELLNRLQRLDRAFSALGFYQDASVRLN
ncbi:MAG: hypothetical protein ACUVXI_01570 [bacterium]